MTNTNNNDMFTNNSLDLARMYGLDPYSVNNGERNSSMTQESRNNNDIVNDIYNDELNAARTENTNPDRDPITGKLNPRRPIMESFRQNWENMIPPEQVVEQTFPTQHGEEAVNNVTRNNLPNMQENQSQQMRNSQSMMWNNFSNMQSNNGQGTMQRNQNQQGETSQSVMQNNLDAIYDAIRRAEIVPNDIKDLNSFLRTQIGRNTTVQSLVGTNTLVERSGILVYVGQDYIILDENIPGDNILIMEIANIRFIRFDL